MSDTEIYEIIRDQWHEYTIDQAAYIQKHYGKYSTEQYNNFLMNDLDSPSLLKIADHAMVETFSTKYVSIEDNAVVSRNGDIFLGLVTNESITLSLKIAGKIVETFTTQPNVPRLAMHDKYPIPYIALQYAEIKYVFIEKKTIKIKWYYANINSPNRTHFATSNHFYDGDTSGFIAQGMYNLTDMQNLVHRELLDFAIKIVDISVPRWKLMVVKKKEWLQNILEELIMVTWHPSRLRYCFDSIEKDVLN